jgi:hypothetical protein
MMSNHLVGGPIIASATIERASLSAIDLLSARKRQSAAQKESSSPEEPEVEIFAHFRILRRPDGSLFRLGKGGMGVTYKAIDNRHQAG